MTYGEYRRTKPRLNVLRGWKGNEPQSLSHVATPAAGVDIYSGQLITLNEFGKWVLYDYDDHKTSVPYFAYSDAIWNAADTKILTDTDVASSGLLLGLSCLGEYEIQTAYFDATQTYAHGAAVKGSASVPGSLTVGDYAAANAAVGIVSRAGMEDIAKINSEATPDNNGKVYVLNLVLRWHPASA